MTTERMPSADDPWADLYRDLDLDAESVKTESFSDAVHSINAAPEEIPFEASEDDSLFDTGNDDPNSAGSSDQFEDGEGDEPGTRKKRRRRRRKKKRTGDEAESFENAGGTDSQADSDDDSEEEGVPAAVTGPGVDLDESTPEMVREVIANWNVPSWTEIVTGLYRPDR